MSYNTFSVAEVVQEPPLPIPSPFDDESVNYLLIFVLSGLALVLCGALSGGRVSEVFSVHSPDLLVALARSTLGRGKPCASMREKRKGLCDKRSKCTPCGKGWTKYLITKKEALHGMHTGSKPRLNCIS